MYPVGSPFFKNDREYSEASRKTKALTINNTTDRSNDASSNRDKEDYIKSEKFNEEMIGLNILEDARLWQNFENQTPVTVPQEQSSRARSMGKP